MLPSKVALKLEVLQYFERAALAYLTASGAIRLGTLLKCLFLRLALHNTSIVGLHDLRNALNTVCAVLLSLS